MLLSISVLSIFVAETGLIPAKISALGIDFEKTDQRAFLIILALVVLYFVIAFALYGMSDFLAWRVTYNDSAAEAYQTFYNRIDRRIRGEEDESKLQAPSSWVSLWPRRLAVPLSLIRAVFEFLLPVMVGAYAIYALIFIAHIAAA